MFQGDFRKEKNIMIRKGLVFILTNEVDYTYEYILSKIPNDKITEKRTMLGQKIIMVNDYRLTILDNTTLIVRGHKPEISYVIGNIVTPKFGNNEFLTYISNISTRKEPVRKINSIEQLDVKEFIDDKYAEENYCNKRKVKRWDDMINPKEADIKKWKKEYECTWIGGKSDDR
jgi:hypothetical protein